MFEIRSMDWKSAAAIGAIAIVILAALVFGKRLETDWISINPRTDIVEVNNLAQLIKQDASERAIILIGRRDGQRLPSYSSCAEPPPDALQDVARSISASFDALAKLNEGQQAGAALQAADDLKTASKALFERSQGIQLLRDTMFRLCEAFQNGVIDPESYSRLIESLILNANFIIPFEQCMSITRFGDKLDQDILNSVVKVCLEAAVMFNDTFVKYSLDALDARLTATRAQTSPVIRPSPKENQTDHTSSDPETEVQPTPETEARITEQERPRRVGPTPGIETMPVEQEPPPVVEAQ